MCDCGGELTDWCFDCGDWVCDDCGCLNSFEHYPFNDESDEPNPTTGLWDKRNTPSGHFDAVKRSGDVFRGVKREN